MLGIRTPVKKSMDTRNPNPEASPEVTEKAGPSQTNLTFTSSVRRSIGEWELGIGEKPLAKSSQVLPKQTPPPSASTAPKGSARSQENKTGTRSAQTATGGSPAKLKYTSRMAEAKACLSKAKLHLGNSRNLKTEIKTEVTQAVERLYQLVREAEKDKLLAEVNQNTEQTTQSKARKSTENSEIGRQDPGRDENNDQLNTMMEIQLELLKENSKKIDELKEKIDRQQEQLSERTYADAAKARPAMQLPQKSTLHSVVVTSQDENDTGDQVMEKVREAVNAKEGWIKVERTRKGKDRKIIMSCGTEEDRRKIKQRLEKAGKNLVVEEVKNKDPLLILRDVLSKNTDEDVIKALRNQNREVFRNLNDEEDRVQIKYRRRARNPHVNHIVISTSPTIWRRATEIGSVHIDLQRIVAKDHSPLVQCTRCLGYGHGKRFCSEAMDLCSHCGGPHLRAECEDWLANAPPVCRNCTKAKLDEVEHNAFSLDCPTRRKWDKLARSSVAYC